MATLPEFQIKTILLQLVCNIGSKSVQILGIPSVGYKAPSGAFIALCDPRLARAILAIHRDPGRG
ncbi:hypothetical protein GO007_06815 [Raoultella sp. 10-1]|nr:hypothetical protein [Raoultella sp. 10-1]